MVDLIVINSFGPMASTLVSGLIEKMGYLNVPVRKIGLHKYLMGEIELNSGLMQNRLEEILLNHSQPSFSGGVSVLDRADQKKKVLVDYQKIKGDLKEYKTKRFDSIQDLYQATKDLYAKAVTYKEVDCFQGKHIELTVDIPTYNFKTLQARYLEEFDSVKFIHLHRPFCDWLNSTASQAFVHPYIKNRYYFFPHKRYYDFQKYEIETKNAEGLQLEFSELFDLGIENLFDHIAQHINSSLPRPENLKNCDYDMYGKLVPFQRAFVPFDAKISYLSKETQDYFENEIRMNDFTNYLGCFISWTKYISDMHTFRQKMKKSLDL